MAYRHAIQQTISKFTSSNNNVAQLLNSGKYMSQRSKSIMAEIHILQTRSRQMIKLSQNKTPVGVTVGASISTMNMVVDSIAAQLNAGDAFEEEDDGA